jgi:hypothetical protein
VRIGGGDVGKDNRHNGEERVSNWKDTLAGTAQLLGGISDRRKARRDLHVLIIGAVGSRLA